MRLPTELLAQIVNYLDPVCDRNTLVTLVRACSIFYDLGMPILYRKVTLDGLGINKLVAAGFHISKKDGASYDDFVKDEYGLVTTHKDWKERYGHMPCPAKNSRWRKSLGFIHYLTVEAPLFRKSRQMLRNVCLPGEPLFPGVQHLRLRASEDWDKMPTGTGESYKDLYPQPVRDLNFVLFECPDLCVEMGKGLELLPGIPSRGYRYNNVTFHMFLAAAGNGDQLPTRWTTFRIFDGIPDILQQNLCTDRERLRDKVARMSAGGSRPVEALFPTALPSDIFTPRETKEYLAELAELQEAWEQFGPSVQGQLALHIGDPQMLPTFRPCSVCGAFRRGMQSY